MKEVKHLFQFLKQDKRALILMMIFTTFKSLLTITGSIIFGYVIQNIFVNITLENPIVAQENWIKLLKFTGISAALYFVLFICHVTSAKIAIKTAYNTTVRIRDIVFRKIHKIDLLTLEKIMHGEIINKISVDIDLISTNLSTFLSEIFSTPIVATFIIIALFVISPYLTLIILGLMVFMFIVQLAVIKVANKRQKKTQDLYEKISTFIEEHIQQYELIKSLDIIDIINQEFKELCNQYLKANLRSSRIFSTIYPINFLFEDSIIIAGFVFSLLFQALNIPSGSPVYFIKDINLGLITIFNLMLRFALGELGYLFRVAADVQVTFVSIKRIKEFLDLKQKFEYQKQKIDKLQSIKFENVSFSYDDKNLAINDVSFEIKANSSIALVGETGSGKSTIMNLLSRYYQPTKGHIYLNDMNYTKIDEYHFNEMISVVLQDSVMFSDTIYNNIACVNQKATKEQVIQAAKDAKIHDFIDNLKDGYDTYIDENQTNLSSGQLQQIALARAFLSDAEILIMDEATSSVDSKTEKNIQDAIFKLMKNKTVILIAHRLSTIINVDNILVMKQGKIVESGNHEQLIAKKGYYYELNQVNVDESNLM
ncbi:ABC transporter ATP-binding protein [Mycoplasma bradburyae]|uniref:ABC transporter ATP-binding protein n=1 Tax=Mycoplasma bradburyae TaxID=2963128 RepID=UPI0020CE28AA|nr:ABC transporter ATP-binding protein [Mycoplasma bradburyae]UTS70510.1 ABC transporter ATP-binding protein/permease [Mycoplasma bradburyae]